MKKLVLLVSGMFILNSLIFCVENENWKTWCEKFLKSFKYKIDKKINTNVKVTAVMAVRGEKIKDNAFSLYWKGSESQKAKEKIDFERKTIKEAIENALNGDIAKARKQLEDFINRNPDSYLLNEAKEVLDKLPKEESVKEVDKKLPTTDNVQTEEK